MLLSRATPVHSLANPGGSSGDSPTMPFFLTEGHFAYPHSLFPLDLSLWELLHFERRTKKEPCLPHINVQSCGISGIFGEGKLTDSQNGKGAAPCRGTALRSRIQSLLIPPLPPPHLCFVSSSHITSHQPGRHLGLKPRV